MPPVHADRTAPLTVDNIGFLLDRLGRDCAPLQFLRELTQNSIEAIQTAKSKRRDIVWDVDWPSVDLADQPIYKLSITDTGCGMTGPEMHKFINQLSASARQQSAHGNYGVGAKIAAATKNHHGLVYLSWKDGKGAMIHLWRDPDSGEYGLRQILRPNGEFGHWAEVEDDIKPEMIGDHGTKIILYGNTEDEDTMKAPPGASSPSAWIAKYLNSRYFEIPSGISVKARQGWEQPRENTDVNLLRTVTGQRRYLEKHTAASGTVPLDGALAHWWVLKDEKALSSNSGFVESAGHIAALYQGELYEPATGRSGYAKLQHFGIVFGQKRVVIYIEPKPGSSKQLTTNTARTQLILNDEPLPWTEWAAQFRENMPDEIEALIEEIASKSTDTDHAKSIRERLKNMMGLFKVSRYKLLSSGQLQIGDPTPNAGGQLGRGDDGQGRNGRGGRRSTGGGAVGGIYSAFLKKDGQPGAEANPDLFPQVTWVSVEEGTREPGEMEDKAARYLEDQNRLHINADFRAFTDMIGHWCKEYQRDHGSIPGLRPMVVESVRSWFQQALVETVLGLQALKGSREWSAKDLEDAWSEAALTSVVMQRYHPYNSIKRELGTKVASLKKSKK